MNRIHIVCESCDRLWSVVGQLSFYERQAMEARPCPKCGAYTLTCEEPVNKEAKPLPRREAARAG